MNMSDHWQTIEVELQRTKEALLFECLAHSFTPPAIKARLDKLDAALAFVREQRAAAWEPVPDDIEIQDIERNTWLSVERGGALISMSRHDTEDDPIAHDLFGVGLPTSVRLCRKQGGDA
jgi:hypothetical protein